MGLVDGFKKAVMKDSPPVNSSQSSNPGNSSGQTPSVFSLLASTPTVPASASGIVSVEIDQEIYNALISAMNSVSAPGLQEFLTNVESLSAFVDSSKVSRAALDLLSKKGITVVQINSELSRRASALDSQFQNFNDAAERQFKVDVGGKEDEVVKVDQQIESRRQQMNIINEEINSLQAKRTKLMEETAATRQRIETKKSGLVAAHNKIKQELAQVQAKLA